MNEMINKTTDNNEQTAMPATIGFASLANMEALSFAAEELAGLELTFDRIKIPSGGTTMFEVPDGDSDEMQLVKEITCIVLYHHPAYAYYREKYTGGTNPPDCGSFDGITGIGDPGGECADCPLNRFGSGEGQGKACKNRRMIYILLENEMLPMMLSLPTGSLKEFTKYLKRQLSKGRRLSQIVTKISLKKVSNSNGLAYSQVAFRFERVLNEEEKKAASVMTETVREYAAHLTVAALAVPEDENGFVYAETGDIPDLPFD